MSQGNDGIRDFIKSLWDMINSLKMLKYELQGDFPMEPLPAPGNRSNERRYKEKDLARTEEKKVGTGKREKSGWRKTRGGEKKIWLDDGCINPAVYLQFDDHVHPGNCPAAVSSEKKQDLLHMEFYHHLPSWAMNEQMSYFSSFSDEWSRDLKSVQVQKQRSCRAQDLDESPDPSMSKIVLRNLIISSKYYKEEEAKELLEVITAERLETEQQQKLEQQEQLSIEKLRLEMELSRIANQSATQNNGQTSRVKSLDEIVKMVRLLTVKVPNKSDGWEYFFSSLEKAFASEMVSDELKPKVLFMHVRRQSVKLIS
ncbi:hypothetical protein TNCV_3606971 [Trichonephila clavipes]|nr:hypothetical protein TNCV_3606971 [Trichonephila clavipes]